MAPVRLVILQFWCLQRHLFHLGLVDHLLAKVGHSLVEVT
jgi:hypothetical protein